jgi:hypothetical protein
MKNRKQRRRELVELDVWLQRLRVEHPWQFRFLSLGVTLAVLAVAVLLKCFLEWVGR